MPRRFLLIVTYVVYAFLAFMACGFIILMVWRPQDHDKHVFRAFLAIFSAVGLFPTGFVAIALFNRCHAPALVARLEAIAARKEAVREARKQRRA
jgi:predicted permease